MKKMKNLLTLTIILAALLGIAFVFKITTKKKVTHNYPFSKTEAAAITKFKITNKNNENFEFVKDGEKWLITYPVNFPLAKDPIDEILTKLPELELKDVISSQKDKFGTFEVADSSSVRVIFYQKSSEQPRADFILGKAALDYNHFYYRNFSENTVYFSCGLPRYLFERTLVNWQNKVLYDLSRPEALEELEVLGTVKSLIKLAKKENEWYVNEQKADPQKVSTYLQSIVKLEGDDIVAKEKEPRLKEYGLEKKFTFSLIFKTKDTEEKILVGKEIKDKKQYYVKKEGDATVYLVNDYKIKNINKSPAELLPDTPQK